MEQIMNKGQHQLVENRSEKMQELSAPKQQLLTCALSLVPFLLLLLLSSCSTQQKIARSLGKDLLNDSALTNAHVGVAIYNPGNQSFLYKHNSTKFFVPASNTKLPTLYAGMKYLGDSLAGLAYWIQGDTVYLQPTGDPTFLHPDYQQQPVYDFLKKGTQPMAINNAGWKTEALGYGWTWDDYLGDYSAERSPLPIYGNIIKWIQEKTIEQKASGNDTSLSVVTDPEINWPASFATKKSNNFDVTRPRTENVYTIYEGKEMKRTLQIPFVTNGLQSALELLKDTLHKNIVAQNFALNSSANFQIIHSQPSDSMFKPLMHRSDNFFAEQTLMMVSQQIFGYMDEQKLIEKLLKTDLSGFPQKPKWVDGSGLSRYNLFTPEDFIWLLAKMKDEFGLERLKVILPTGNDGTLKNYYKEEAGLIFAKTGTLTGHVALSGFLITAKNKLLIFSVQVNNHNGSTTAVRRAVERFLEQIRREN